MASRRAVSRAPRRKLIWARMTPAISSLANIGAASAFTEAQDLLQTFRTQAGILAGPVGLTVVRMRFHIASTQVVLANTSEFILGVRVMDTTEAVSAEAGAEPYVPATQPHEDWMCFEPFGVTSTTPGGFGIVDHYVDVRSMRKIDELGQTLVMLVGSVPPFAGGAGIAVNMSITSSVLLALP